MSIFRKLVFKYWYFRNPPWDANQTPPEVLKFIENNPPGKALDLGCGTGTNAFTLAQNSWQVIGVDFVGKAVNAAKQKAKKAQVNIDFRVGNVTKLSGIAGPFDLILDIGCYHNLSVKGMEDYRMNVDRLLKTGGTFLLYAFFRDRDSKPDPGVVDADLEAFSPPLNLVSRTDGLERGSRPSAWLKFQKGDL